MTHQSLVKPPLVMGIVNVTPDSFSDGGRLGSVEAAVAHAMRLVAETGRGPAEQVASMGCSIKWRS